MRFLLEEGAAAASGATQWILPAVLLVLVIGIFVLNYFRSKKSKENMQNMVNNIKVGDKVKTYSGFYGKIIEITETTDGKVAVLETGNDGNHGYVSIDMNAIYAIDEKKPVVLDANGNIIDPDAKAEPAQTQNETTEEVKEEKVEVKEIEIPVEETKVKPIAKKSTAKKSTAKTTITAKKTSKKENE